MMSAEANGQATVWFGEAPTSQQACDVRRDDLARSLRADARDRRGLLREDLVLDHAAGRLRRHGRGHHLQEPGRLGRGVDQAPRRLSRRPRPIASREGSPASRPGSPRRPIADRMTTGPTPRDDRTPPASRAGRRPPRRRGSTPRRVAVPAPPPPGRAAAGRAARLAGHRLPRRRCSSCCSTRSGRRTRSPARSSPFAWSLDAFADAASATDVYRIDRDADGRHGDPGHGHRRRCSPSRSPTTWPAIASPRVRGLLVIAVLMPLWAAYLVKVYAWRIDPPGQRLRSSGSLDAVRHRRRPGLDELANAWLVLQLPLAAVHDPADLRRASSGSRARCSRRRPTSAAGPGRRSGASSCRSSSRRSSRARSSRSR